MIEVTWRYFYLDPVYGDEKYKDERTEVPRVPRVGDFVKGYKVVKVSWYETMDGAFIELRDEK